MTPVQMIDQDIRLIIEKDFTHEIENLMMEARIKRNTPQQRVIAQARLITFLDGYKKLTGRPHPITEIEENSPLFDCPSLNSTHTTQ